MKLLCVSVLLLGAIAVSHAQSNPVPLINNPLVPASAAPGGGDFTLTVNGTGFVPGSTVNWNGTPLATTFVSGSQLSATVPSADVAGSGTASVIVVNPTPGGGSSNVDFFEIREPFSAASFGLATLNPGTQPAWIISADVNSDGRLDLITTLLADSAVSVSLGNGDGTFQPAKEYATADIPEVVIATDLNGDGTLDLVVSNSIGVSVLLGNGDGTFQLHQDFVFSFGAQVVAGDMNHDGKLDLAVALVFSGQVAILLGNGDGTFQPAVDYTAGQNSTFNLALGDFNQDGNLDLAVTVQNSDAVAILKGNGDGSFGSPVDYAAGGLPLSVIAADFNNDGSLDLAVGNSSSRNVSVLLGNGDGTFQTPVDYTSPLGVLGGILATDLNGDGSLDIVVSTNGTMIATFLGLGDGTFKIVPGLFAVGLVTDGLAAGDFNGDGRVDLVAANFEDNTLSVLPQLTSVLSKTNIAFNKVTVGNSATVRMTLSNIGASSFTISRLGLTGRGAAQFSESSNCRSSLAAGASCTVKITFQPLSAGPFSAFLKVQDTASTAPQTVILRGTGVN